MDKRRLSQLLDDSAFPLLVLAMAVAQMSLEPNRRPVPRQDGQLSIEFQSHGRLGPVSRNSGSGLPTWSSPVAKRTGSDKQSDYKE
jgi:hypothetical protein